MNPLVWIAAAAGGVYLAYRYGRSESDTANPPPPIVDVQQRWPDPSKESAEYKTGYAKGYEAGLKGEGKPWEARFEKSREEWIAEGATLPTQAEMDMVTGLQDGFKAGAEAKAKADRVEADAKAAEAKAKADAKLAEEAAEEAKRLAEETAKAAEEAKPVETVAIDYSSGSSGSGMSISTSASSAVDTITGTGRVWTGNPHKRRSR